MKPGQQGIPSSISSLFLLSLHYHYPVHRSRTQFPLISLPDDPPRPVFTIFPTFIPVFQLLPVTVPLLLFPLFFPTCFGVFDDLKMAHLAAFRL